MSPTRAAIISALIGGMGTTLVLSELRWFARTTLGDRLRPYVRGTGSVNRSGLLSVASFRDVVAPLAAGLGARVARTVGITEDLELRLHRLHSDLDVADIRLRQVGWAAAAGGAGLALAVGVRPTPAVAVLIVVALLTLAFLVPEQQIATASARHQRRVLLELPVVAEQMATLIGAGWSLSGAVGRVAERGSGACAADLRRVHRRIQQGADETTALREWAATAKVDAVDRIVPVLALNRETSDLGRLLAEESRAIRRSVHRELLETIERRSQQVWIPVTVATLVPGVIFLAVPFIEALRVFSGG